MSEKHSEHAGLEQSLRDALRRADPDESFVDGVLHRIEESSSPAESLRLAQRSARARWVPLSLAACALVAVGLVHWQHNFDARNRGLQARDQLLEALSIASEQANTARTAVMREEQTPN